MHPSDFVDSLSLVDIRAADHTAGLELVDIKEPTGQPMPDTADLKAAVNAASSSHTSALRQQSTLEPTSVNDRLGSNAVVQCHAT